MIKKCFCTRTSFEAARLITVQISGYNTEMFLHKDKFWSRCVDYCTHLVLILRCFCRGLAAGGVPARRWYNRRGSRSVHRTRTAQKEEGQLWRMAGGRHGWYPWITWLICHCITLVRGDILFSSVFASASSFSRLACLQDISKTIQWNLFTLSGIISCGIPMDWLDN